MSHVVKEESKSFVIEENPVKKTNSLERSKRLPKSESNEERGREILFAVVTSMVEKSDSFSMVILFRQSNEVLEKFKIMLKDLAENFYEIKPICEWCSGSISALVEEEKQNRKMDIEDSCRKE